jgi:hypothetical protein
MNPVTPTKRSLKEEIMEEVTEKLIDNLQDKVNQKVHMYSRNFKTPQTKKTWEDTETTKWTQRGLQQIPKWNKRDHLKRDIWNKKRQHKILKRSWTKIWKRPRKKTQTEILEI